MLIAADRPHCAATSLARVVSTLERVAAPDAAEVAADRHSLQNEQELALVRDSLKRNRPFAAEDWVRRTAGS